MSTVTSKLMEEDGRLYRGERMDLKIFSETGQTTSMALETYQESSG